MAYYSFTKDIDEGNEISIYNGGQMSRDMTYVTDIVEGILKSINRLGDNKRNKHEIFNLGNENPIKLGILLSKIESNLGKRLKLFIKHPMERWKTLLPIYQNLNWCLDINQKYPEDGMNEFYKLQEYYET